MTIRESMIKFGRSLILPFVVLFIFRTFRIIYQHDFQFSKPLWFTLLENLVAGMMVTIILSIIFFVYLLLRAKFYKPKRSK